jgi:hypothetical protein
VAKVLSSLSFEIYVVVTSFAHGVSGPGPSFSLLSVAFDWIHKCVSRFDASRLNVCLTWHVCAVLWFAPHWMSYFNEAAGGPLRGHEWLVDSNIDWGEDILMLKWWHDRHPEAADLQAALFTGFDPRDIGLKFRLAAPFVAGEPQIVSHDGLRGPQPSWYAISVCQLKGHSFSVPTGDGSWNWSNGESQE